MTQSRSMKISKWASREKIKQACPLQVETKKIGH